MLGVSSPTKCGVAGDPLGSEFASVIYGFVLLLGIPTLVCVLPAPGRLRGPTPVLSTWLGNPSAAVLSWEVPCLLPSAGGLLGALCLQTPALLPPTLSRGTRAAAPVSLGKLCPAWLGEGP